MVKVGSETLSKWMVSQGMRNRVAAARSELTPPYLLVLLARGGNTQTTRVAVRNKNFPLDALDKGLKESPYFYLISPYVPEPLLRRTYEIAHKTTNFTFTKEIIQRILEHPSCPTDILEKYVHSVDLELKAAVAENSNTPLPYVVEMINDVVPRVQAAAVRNVAVTEEMLVPLIETANAKLLTSLVRRLTGANQKRVIERLKAFNPGLNAKKTIARYTDDSELAYEMCADENVKVRRAAVYNQVTPEEGKVLATLIGGDF